MEFEGIIAPVLTEFSADGSQPILSNVPKYAQHLASKGVQGVLVNGTSGEGPSMTTEERKAVAEAWTKAAHAHKMHVQVQVGGTNFRDVLNLAKHAESIGADSILTLPELYFKPQSTGDCVQFIKYVAEAAPKTPVLYYHIPSFSSVNVNIVEVMKEAGKVVSNFAGIKFTDGDLNVGSACANLDPKRFKVFLGCDTIMAGAYLLGFNSATATSVNFFPNLSLDILKAVKAGQLAQANQLQNKLSAIVHAIIKYGTWVPTMKAAFEIVTGIPAGTTRFPLKQLSDGEVLQLTADLKKLGAI